jgi:hypothetical protein
MAQAESPTGRQTGAYRMDSKYNSEDVWEAGR